MPQERACSAVVASARQHRQGQSASYQSEMTQGR
jgi:hypothetical protein